MSEFVLEIGTEELPARFLAGLEKEAVERFNAAMSEAGYENVAAEAWSTPRRTVLRVAHLEEHQPLREELVQGPPARIAFDAQGHPTKAAEGFAKTLGIAVDSLTRTQTEKGEYLTGVKKTGGVPTVDVLAKVCPALIGALSFAKSMRWGSGSFAFARPIRWILALFGDQIVPFEIDGVWSGNRTMGHRVMGHGPFEVPSASEYPKIVREQGKVEPDAAKRRKIILEQGEAGAKAIGGKIIWKESLLDEVQGLVEYPVPLIGDIDPSYLELPREVLLTSMETHQKSFGMEDAQGKLLPHFLTVLNLIPKDTAVVKKGWERVLRARLEDARFFWKTDLAASFDEWLHSLDTVIFLAPLGSMGEKTQRISALCASIAKKVGENPEAAARAGRLSKADLVSAMVGEFDTLQGLMGGIYAQKMGEPQAVATALTEQYLPAGPDSPVPATALGSILSIADKIDTLVGAFGLGMQPTGAADPYALRRCALGIIRIMLERNYRFDLQPFFDEAVDLYGDRRWKVSRAEARKRLQAFLAGRARNYFLLQGYDTPLVDAVMAVNPEKFCFVRQRLQTLTKLEKEADFANLAQTFKRVANIIRKQATELSGSWDANLLQEASEKKFASDLEQLFATFEKHWEADDIPALFADLASIRPSVDAFFDSVMVMCEDQDLRVNRLNLLKSLALRMERVADFASLQS